MRYEFPDQTIPESKKDIEFHKKHIYAYIDHTRSSEYSKRQRDIVELSYAVSAIPSPKMKAIIEKTLTQKYGEDFTVPFEIYPLIEQKIEELVGYYRLRPLRSKTSVINRDGVNSKLEEIVSNISEAVHREVNEEMKEEIGFSLETDNPDIEVPSTDPNEVTKYIENFKTENEKIGEFILDYLLNSKNEKEKIYNALFFYLCFGDFGIFIEEKNGNPSLYVPHPLEYYSTTVPTENIHDDVEIVVLDNWMTENEILNKFDLNTIERKKVSESFKNGEADFESPSGALSSLAHSDFVKEINGFLKSRVVTMLWKSRRKLEYKRYGERAKKINDIDDKEKKRIIDKEEYEHYDIENIRHITMLGSDIVLSWGELPDQIESVGDVTKRFIPFVRCTSDNILRNGEMRSLAKKLKPLQDFYSEVFWELKFNTRQMDGNVLVYDWAMFPKELFRDVQNNPSRGMNKILTQLKKERVMFINSKDKRSNHYASSVNISQKGRIEDLIKTLALIDQMADKISGIPSQQQNQVYQKATVAEIQAQNTTARMEEYIGLFESAIERSLNYLISKGKQLYKNNDIISYVAGDGVQKFIQVTEDFSNEDYGVKFINNRKDYETKMKLDEAASRVMGSSNDFDAILGMLDVLYTDNYEEARSILAKSREMIEQRRKQEQEAAQQPQIEANEIAKQEMEWDKEKHYSELENKITLKEMDVNSKIAISNNQENTKMLSKASEVQQSENSDALMQKMNKQNN